MKYRTILLLVLSFAALGNMVLADGWPHKGNRYAAQKVVLTLTPSQIQQALQEGHKITLTPEQKALLIRSKGFSPSTLTIISAREAYSDCSCFFYNNGIQYQSDRVDVPVDRHFLLSDADAQQRAAANKPAKKAWWRFW